MTEIVDERQRLAAVRDAILAEHGAAMTELGRLQGDRNDAVTVNWQGGKCNGLAHALQFAEHALASRPQEQPRKATGELPAEVQKALISLRMDDPRITDQTPRAKAITTLENALKAALSVSPAAAQGWQVVPIVPTEAMLRAATMIAPTWDDAASRAKYAAMLAAAPPSPAAQEQK